MTSTHFNPRTVLISVFLTAWAAGAHAEPGQRNFDRLAKKLNLTTEQQASVEQIRAAYTPDRDARQAQREEVKALVESGNADAAADLAASHAREAVLRRAQMRNELSQVLTEDQMQQLDAMMEKRRDRSGKQRRRGQRGGFGDNTG
ncbi:MAG: Spy/CpxP family protein refolding chaperone [Pseudomonadota bacterium]